jgi:hypothetical protein
MAYEWWLVAGRDGPAQAAPQAGRTRHGRVSWRSLFTDWHARPLGHRLLQDRRSEAVMRSFREIVHRAALDGREATLVRAMGIEVVRSWPAPACP